MSTFEILVGSETNKGIEYILQPKVSDFLAKKNSHCEYTQWLINYITKGF